MQHAMHHLAGMLELLEQCLSAQAGVAWLRAEGRVLTSHSGRATVLMKDASMWHCTASSRASMNGAGVMPSERSMATCALHSMAAVMP